jgi:hypothetical protein
MSILVFENIVSCNLISNKKYKELNIFLIHTNHVFSRLMSLSNSNDNISLHNIVFCFLVYQKKKNIVFFKNNSFLESFYKKLALFFPIRKFALFVSKKIPIKYKYGLKVKYF